ncbi:SIR2 family NAD-dependent protein deacylase [Desulfogranum japonicum]|uniref:SIR2 family NAD-dependent protein deacylase n=1 Tax=Desulfogranum japonicum TaxID=231447 RepID=UPI000687416D|nr:NAD-dependent deacylase [Desulfogranum japonicum]
MHTVDCQKNIAWPQRLANCLQQARYPVALTGAGISVASGIPDFRSVGGLWSMFPPQEYATLRVFQKSPKKAWCLYRALGKMLQGAKPNKAHKAIAQLQQMQWLKGLITQNIDGLHQEAGSNDCLEIHGNHHMLHCLRCMYSRHFQASDLLCTPYPFCPQCKQPLKPHIVLFGEAVHALDDVARIADQADLLLVIGTSCSVYPAADIPHVVHRNGGMILEFNVEPVLGCGDLSKLTDFYFPGKVTETLPYFVTQVQPVGRI